MLKFIDVGAMLEGIAVPGLCPGAALCDFGGAKIGARKLDRRHYYYRINDVTYVGPSDWSLN